MPAARASIPTATPSASRCPAGAHSCERHRPIRSPSILCRKASPARRPICRRRRRRRPRRSIVASCRNRSALRRLSEFHASGVRLAARRHLRGVSRRRKARHPLRGAGARRRLGHRALRAALGEERELAPRRPAARSSSSTPMQLPAFTIFATATKIVVDVLAPKTDADAYHPPGTAKPTITALLTSTPRPKPGRSQPLPRFRRRKPPRSPRRRKNWPMPTSRLCPPSRRATAPPQPPRQRRLPHRRASCGDAPQRRRNAATADANAGRRADANGQLTRSGAVLTFDGAANRGSAVFVRGLTAWIVLQGAPPLDAVKLKNALRDFPGRGRSLVRRRRQRAAHHPQPAGTDRRACRRLEPEGRSSRRR